MSAAPAKAKTAGDVKLKGYNEKQVLSAATSLLKFVGDRNGKDHAMLFDDDDMVSLTIALKTMPLQARCSNHDCAAGREGHSCGAFRMVPGSA